MIGMVLVCDCCGNVELEVKYVGTGTKLVNFYCPKCGNVGRMRGFTAGSISLEAYEVDEITRKAVKPLWKKSAKYKTGCL